MQKTVVVLGTFINRGVSDNGPYEMTRLYVGKPLEDRKTKSGQIFATGYEVSEMDATLECVESAAKHADKFPCLMTVDVGAYEDRFGNFKPQIQSAELAKSVSGPQAVSKTA
mgnify:CR=1 FL=1